MYLYCFIWPKVKTVNSLNTLLDHRQDQRQNSPMLTNFQQNSWTRHKQALCSWLPGSQYLIKAITVYHTLLSMPLCQDRNRHLKLSVRHLLVCPYGIPVVKRQSLAISNELNEIQINGKTYNKTGGVKCQSIFFFKGFLLLYPVAS